jgi:hypothetical protein
LLAESRREGLEDPERPQPAEQPDAGSFIGHQGKQIRNPGSGPSEPQRRGRVLAQSQRVDQGPDQRRSQEGPLEEGNAVSTW